MNIVLLKLPAFVIHTPPYNLASLAASLKSRGHDVEILDLDLEAYRLAGEEVRNVFWARDNRTRVAGWKDDRKRAALIPEQLMQRWQERVLALRPDIIGFSLYWVNYPSSVEFAALLRKSTRARIVFGGPHCCRESGVPSDLISRGVADAVVVGEGEETLVELAEDFGAGRARACPGAVVRTAAGVEDGGPRVPAAGLDAFPVPDFSGLPLSEYRSLPVSSSRGCLYRCAYCADCRQWGGFRSFRAERVAAEIERGMRRHGIFDFEFVDHLVNGDLAEFEKLCRLLLPLHDRYAKHLSWGGFAAPRAMSEDLVRLMNWSGCTRLSVGIESGSERILNRFGKSMDLDAAAGMIRACHANNISVTLNWIIGFPGETEDDFARTVAFARSVQPYAAGFRPANPFMLSCGSSVGKDPSRYGIARYTFGDSIRWEDGITEMETRVMRLNEFNRIISACYEHRIPLPNERLT